MDSAVELSHLEAVRSGFGTPFQLVTSCGSPGEEGVTSQASPGNTGSIAE